MFSTLIKKKTDKNFRTKTGILFERNKKKPIDQTLVNAYIACILRLRNKTLTFKIVFISCCI